MLDGATYGAYMIDTLRQRDLVVVFRDQTRKTLFSNDVTDELIEECLALMLHWVDMLEAAIRAECPTWELLQAFQCLSLSEKGKHIEAADAKGIPHIDDLDEDATDSKPLYSKYIDRLANLVGCGPATLRSEIQMVKPLANTYYQISAGMEPRDAWGQIVHQRLQWAKRYSERKDTDKLDFTALRKVIGYYAAWGVSTCGVERGIGDYRHIFGKYKNSADIQKVNDEIECTYIPDSDEIQMCTIAANLYIQAYGIQRERDSENRLRCGTGTSRRWKRVHALPASETPRSNSLKLCHANAAEVYRQTNMSVQQMVKYGKNDTDSSCLPLGCGIL